MQVLPCEQWFLKAEHYASMGKTPLLSNLRATVCFAI